MPPIYYGSAPFALKRGSQALNLYYGSTLISGGAAVPVGGVAHVAIADSTLIDPISSIGVDGAGWVAVVTLKGLTSLVGTLDATKLAISVTDPGFDTAGNATTVSRTITGIAHLRRQYPNGASKMISTDGTDLFIYVTLDDWIYSGTTIVSASIASGFYPACVASSSPLKTNASNIAYPSPIFGWMNPQSESSGSSHSVESVAFHRHAMNGQQVACIKYQVSDGTNNGSDVLVSATALSSRVTGGNVPEAWIGTIDLSAMNQAAMCTVNAKIYPWIGTMFDVGASGVAWPTSHPMTKLRVFCDRTGGYGGAYAYVKAGASGGTVSAVPATAAADPFPTIVAALTAVKAWNNTNKSHNDLGGSFVRLMDDGAGGAQNHTIGSAAVNSPGLTYCTVEKDPATAAEVSITFTAQSQFPSLMKYRNIKNAIGATTYNWIGQNEADSVICIENCAVDNTNNKTVVAWYAFKYILNMQTIGTNLITLNGLPSATAAVALTAGCYGVGAPNPLGKVFVGNTFAALTVGGFGSGADDGRIVYNNRIFNATVNNLSANTVSLGFANVQNLYERDPSVNTVCMNYFADGDLTTIGNYIDMHNTAVGERSSRMYNDVAGSKVIPSGVVKRGVSKFSIYDNFNFKDDRFTSGAGSVGGWSYGYGVGNVGNISLFGTVNRLSTDAPHNDNAETPYMGSAWNPSSEYNLGRTALGFTQANIMDMFTNYTVNPRGVPAGGGNYKPLSSATHIKSRVPAGKSILKYDIAGALRKTDGTGAAGAYEY